MGQQVCKYLVVIERSDDGFSAYTPDLPCVVSGATREEVEGNIQKAIESYLRTLVDSGQPIPEPRSMAEYVVLEECSDC